MHESSNAVMNNKEQIIGDAMVSIEFWHASPCGSGAKLIDLLQEPS